MNQFPLLALSVRIAWPIGVEVGALLEGSLMFA
jgi:hypothetical protein